MIISVCYELQKPGQNYDVLYETIKTAQSWCHPMTSHWLIRTELSVQTWYDRLRKVMDQNDYLFVVDITGQSRLGWLPSVACDWLRENEYKKAVNY
jgi:hypothetical protein